MRFRKLPVEIEAVQWTGANRQEIDDFTHPNEPMSYFDPDTGSLIIRTTEGNMHAQTGDWSIRGVAGEFYPCKMDIFEQTYEAVNG